MTDEKTTIETLDTPPLCMVEYFTGRERSTDDMPMAARVVSRHDNVIEVDFTPMPKRKARRLTNRWEEASVLLLLAACAAAGLVSLLRH